MTGSVCRIPSMEFSGSLDSGKRPPWFSHGLRFSCVACGRCCRGAPGAVFLLPAEERALAAAFGVNVAEFRARFETTRWRFPSLRERALGECVMHGADGMCRVYALRPLMCRSWPFWPRLLVSPEEWARAARHCPGMDVGELHTPREITSRLAEHLAYERALKSAWRKEEPAWNKASGNW